MLDLRADGSVKREITTNAAARAGELFSPQRYVQTYRALYGLVASKKRRLDRLGAQSHA